MRLSNGATVVLEIKGYEDDQTKAKHGAAKRWVEAVNNWRQLGRWGFHVCRNPQLLDKEMEYLANEHVGAGNPTSRNNEPAEVATPPASA